MWEEEGLVDVTLATDGKCLKAHKIMLSASSPFFKKIFEMNPCQHPVIVLQDVQFYELESILKFVYKGEVCIRQENLPLLLRAAETLQIRGLCQHLTSDSDMEEDSNFETHKISMNDKSHVTRSPPGSPRNGKKFKTHYNSLKSSVLQSDLPVSPKSKRAVPVYPIALDEIKEEPSGVHSPPLSNDKCDDEIHATDLVCARMRIQSDEEGDEEDDENDIPPNRNECAIYLEPGSTNYPFPPFPCPFCDRAYTRWGFRRRHIKACHTRSQSLPCKWCLEVLPTHTEWESHVCQKHSLSKNDARNGLLILEEAEVVLQIPQPSRLDALVTMIKEQNNKSSEENSKDMEMESGLKEEDTGGEAKW
ncbi:hypothetical protein RUM43_009536 [Polyplax serrata]|uniref:Uncharacterized protein n=1 Tax=Polyplax serrata TaxID=468196 RepID=A0AAN8PWL4_POLSC